MNKEYWKEFYKMQEPTDFAKFCVPYIPSNSVIVDMGCGNGRDSYFFGENGHTALGIDYACKPRKLTRKVDFFKTDLKSAIKMYKNFDVIYSRFFIHSITTKEIIAFVNWADGLFMAEFRSKSDKPKLYKDHKRNLVNGVWLAELLKKRGFEILYYKEAKGLAKYKNEDPMVVRVIAKK